MDKLKALAAVDICRECDFETDVESMLEPTTDVASLLQKLLDEGAPKDAVQLLAHSIEPREAVWWAWDIALANSGAAAEPVTAALEATSAWLFAPDDEKRRAAATAADTCGLESPAGCAALAVFLSEGSLGPADLEQEVPVPPQACAKAATGAILLAAVSEPEQTEERANAAVARWFELAATERPWQAGTPPTQPDEIDDSGYDTNLKF